MLYLIGMTVMIVNRIRAKKATGTKPQREKKLPTMPPAWPADSRRDRRRRLGTCGDLDAAGAGRSPPADNRIGVAIGIFPHLGDFGDVSGRSISPMIGRSCSA